jgi:hypothetical protein
MYKVDGFGLITRCSDGASIPRDPSNRDYRDYLDWCIAGNEPEVVDVTKRPEQIIDTLKRAVRAWMDISVGQRQYDDLMTAISYRDDNEHPDWQAESWAVYHWRSRVYDAMISIEAACLAGERAAPTAEELIAELPQLEWTSA